MDGVIEREIAAELTRRREAAQRRAQQRREEAYACAPQLRQLDRALNLVSIWRGYQRLQRSLPAPLQGELSELLPALLPAEAAETGATQAGEAEAVPTLRMDPDALREALGRRRAALMQSMSLTEASFRPVYTCAICGDTGRLPQEQGGGACSCYRILLTEALRKRANLPGGSDTFDRFRADFYPAEPDPQKYGIAGSPREHMEQVKRKCQAFVRDFAKPETSNMLFVGGVGVGKTFFSGCIASALLERGVPVLYMPVSMLFQPFAASAFASDDDRAMLAQLRDMILHVELLIIDDLGTEKQTATRYEEVLEILNTRAVNGRQSPCRTVITTNMTPTALYDVYGERVASRILGTFDILRFVGEDIRLRKRMDGSCPA